MANRNIVTPKHRTEFFTHRRIHNPRRNQIHPIPQSLHRPPRLSKESPHSPFRSRIICNLGHLYVSQQTAHHHQAFIFLTFRIV